MIDPNIAYRCVTLLQEMLKADPEATKRLIAERVQCNATLADHPTIQVHVEHGVSSVGLLGIMNGLCGVNEAGNGGIVVAEDEMGKIVGFELNANYGVTPCASASK
jgi:hypothetical protein